MSNPTVQGDSLSRPPSPAPTQTASVGDQSSGASTAATSPSTSRVDSSSPTKPFEELIIPENPGVEWVLNETKRLATLLAEDKHNEMRRQHGKLKPGAVKPPLFGNLDEAQREGFINHFFLESLVGLAEMMKAKPDGFFDTDIDDGPHETQVGISRAELKVTSSQLATADIAQMMAIGRKEKQAIASRVAVTAKWPTTQKLADRRSAILLATSLTTHRNTEERTLLPSSFNRYLDQLDNFLARYEKPIVP